VYRLYSLLLFIVFALYAPWYYVRTRFFRRDRVYFRERLALGFRPEEGDAPGIWIHAVSVGEVLSLQNFIRELKRRHPEWRLFLSTLTSAGFHVAREKVRDVDRIFFVPLDFRKPVRRVLEALRPRVLVLAESEFWPNLLREAARFGSRVLVVNGRISQTSFKRYAELKPMARRILAPVSRFLVQTDLDRERLVDLGIPPAAVEVAGNLKAEVRLPDLGAQELRLLRRGLGLADDRPVLVAGSTRKGEEERLLRAFAASRRARPDLVLVLAPRQVGRAEDIARLARDLGLRTVRRTEVAAGGAADEWEVLVLDTLGELAHCYALAAVAFIGGSLVPWGGHNILEPAFYRKPIFFGPHMKNFAALAGAFLKAEAARVVRTDEDLAAMFLEAGENKLAAMGERARSVLDSLAGATDRAIESLERMMTAPGRPG
jgi:3-deoxy-D-manno-octulosonic-acid transferase